MKSKATVISVNGTRAVVEVERASACEGCHKNADGHGCSVCTLMGGDRRFRATASNSLGAATGDTVLVETATGRVLWYAVLVFLLPLALAALGWGLAALLHATPTAQALAALGGFVLCFAGLFVYSKLLAKKRPDVEIVEIVNRAEESGEE